jgi:pyruvate formate lyase activating enzyme
MADRGWTRREFLDRAARSGVYVSGGLSVLGAGWLSRLLAETRIPESGPVAELLRTAPKARHWVSTATASIATDCLSCHTSAEVADVEDFAHEETMVGCRLCAQNCRIAPGERGRCKARMNVGGELRSLVYGRPISVHVDPIEKKPFYHFLPGSRAFSMSTSGCPLSCKFCQNWEISQASPEDFRPAYVPPERVREAATAQRAPVIAFTYNEPTVFFEYLTDIARAASEQDIRSVIVSCGFMNEAPLAEMCEVLAGVKIDLKGFSEDFYSNVCGAELKPVLRSIKQVAASGKHLELVNLVVPTLNDSPKMLTELAKWVVGETGPHVPVHFTRFHPDYQLRHLPPTPVATLERAREIALKHGMLYPYVGNVPGHPGNNTYCPKCGEVVIERRGFFIAANRLEHGKCKSCKATIHGVWR